MFSLKKIGDFISENTWFALLILLATVWYALFRFLRIEFMTLRWKKEEKGKTHGIPKSRKKVKMPQFIREGETYEN
jgi:hypothetical protein